MVTCKRNPSFQLSYSSGRIEIKILADMPIIATKVMITVAIIHFFNFPILSSSGDSLFASMTAIIDKITGITPKGEKKKQATKDQIRYLFGNKCFIIVLPSSHRDCHPVQMMGLWALNILQRLQKPIVWGTTSSQYHKRKGYGLVRSL